MKSVFKLDGLNCAHCAQKIESGVAELAGVDSASLNFITLKLAVEHSLDSDALEAQIKKIIKKHEPKVKLIRQ